MKDFKRDKIGRVLGIYTKLLNSYVIDKSTESVNYGVNERSIQRDTDDIRNYLEEDGEKAGCINSVVYDRREKGYHLEQIYKMKLTNSEVFVLSKIPLNSRAFTKKEMAQLLGKLISYYVSKTNQKLVTDLINNEEFHYVGPRHKTKFLDTMWDIGQTIRRCQHIEVDYLRTKDKVVVKQKLPPVTIMFSEHYFYSTAFIDDESVKKDFDVFNDPFPIIYRIDRIKGMKLLDEKLHVPHSSRFGEGEFRKRIQLIHGGKLQKVKFQYSGIDVDAVLDRLPTTQILPDDNGSYILSAEVFGKGIDMWLKS